MVCILFETIPARCQDKYIISHYTNENGLSANGIKGIELDKTNGFLWIGTQAGLVRFDGRRFEIFDHSKSIRMSSRVNIICQNREGTIYCEDDQYQIFQIVRNRPVYLTVDTFLNDSVGVGNDRFSERSAERIAAWFRHRSHTSFLPGWVVFHDRSDTGSFTFNYWGHACHYAAAADSLFCFSGKSNFTRIFKLDDRAYFVTEDLELWEYNDSLKNVSPVSVTNMPVWNRAENDPPQFIWSRGMNEPLLIYKQNIWKLRRNGKTLSLYPFCQDCVPAKAHITAVQFWDEQGIIFFSSDVNGLYVARNAFLHAVRADTTTEAGEFVYAQVESAPRIITTAPRLSFSSQGKLLTSRNQAKFHPYVIYRDHQGDIWSYSQNYINDNWSPISDTVIHFHPEDSVFTKVAVSGSAYKIIFAETGGHLYTISNKAIGEITNDHYREIYKLQVPNVFSPDAAIEWKPGILAIALEKPVLFDIWNRKMDTISIPGLKVKVRSLLKYGAYLMIGTYGQGFYVYKNGLVKKMPLDKNGYLSYAHCFMPDSKGFCWISTNHGLFKVSMHALIAAYEQDLNEIYYHYFGKEDGIFNSELNGGCQPCAIKLTDGQISFPSMNGIVLLDPNRQHTSPPSGRIFVEEIVVDSIVHQPDEPSLDALPDNFENIRIKITLPQFGNPENIYFSYKLEPYNHSWKTQDISQNNILEFGRLPPGAYKLQLRVRNGFEPDQFGITEVRFRILAPWYQLWWSYLIWAVLSVILIWLVVNWRTALLQKRKKVLQALVDRQTRDIALQHTQLEQQFVQLQNQQERLEEDNKIKAKLIAFISHDMVSPLKFMTFVSEQIRDIFSTSDPAYHTANTLVTVTHELESLSVKMLDWIRYHHDNYKVKASEFNLHDLANESMEIAVTLAREKGVQVYNEIPQAIVIWQYRQALGTIIYNLAMNAMKYTEKGTIRIAALAVDNDFILVVEDTGLGMPPDLVEALNGESLFIPDTATPDSKKFQFGYRIIKDLLQLISGTMTVKSERHAGTRISIRFASQQEN